MMMMRKIVRTRGPQLRLNRVFSMSELRVLIDAQTTRFVHLPRLSPPPHVMLVDDDAQKKGLPENAYATSLYLKYCHAGSFGQVLGDVAIVPADDLEGRP